MKANKGRAHPEATRVINSVYEALEKVALTEGMTRPEKEKLLLEQVAEWNVALDANAIVRLLRSDLPIALYPCAANNSDGKGYGAFSPANSYDEHNTYYKLADLRFIQQMDAPLRSYLEFALSRSSRWDFLRALESDRPPIDEKLLGKEHYLWETGVCLCVSGRKLVRRADGLHRILPVWELLPSDRVLPNELHSCEVGVREDGVYEFRETRRPSRVQVYYRGDPRENERALREALPALYLSFRPESLEKP